MYVILLLCVYIVKNQFILYIIIYHYYCLYIFFLFHILLFDKLYRIIYNIKYIIIIYMCFLFYCFT